MRIVCKVFILEQQCHVRDVRFVLFHAKNSARKLNLHNMIKDSEKEFCFITAWCLTKNSISSSFSDQELMVGINLQIA